VRKEGRKEGRKEEIEVLARALGFIHCKIA
jgi:hypothetical protein